MKKFVRNLSAYLTICGVAWLLVLAAKIIFNQKRFGFEVFEAISGAMMTHANATSVILGDSVANQLFARDHQHETGEYVYLASNQAITPIGNCALLKMYLEHNPQTKNVYYVLLPRSLTNDGAILYTFHYMLYPFIESNAIKYLEEESVVHLRKRFSSFVFDVPLARRMIYADDFCYNIYEWWIRRRFPCPADKIPPECLRALDKMNDMCARRNIRFILLSSPVVDTSVAANENIIHHLLEIDNGGYARFYSLSQLLVPDEWLCDHIHFHFEILKAKRREIISEMFHRAGVKGPCSFPK